MIQIPIHKLLNAIFGDDELLSSHRQIERAQRVNIYPMPRSVIDEDLALAIKEADPNGELAHIQILEAGSTKVYVLWRRFFWVNSDERAREQHLANQEGRVARLIEAEREAAIARKGEARFQLMAERMGKAVGGTKAVVDKYRERLALTYYDTCHRDEDKFRDRVEQMADILNLENLYIEPNT
jgi:hypothetical protein